jgi:phospholipid transport system substrate-binding protein
MYLALLNKPFKKEIRLTKNILIVLLMSVLLPINAYSAQPIDILKNAIDQVIFILEDPAYEDNSLKTAQKEKLWNIIREIFDFEEMSKRTLARNWKDFSPQQQTDFIEVFGEFLSNNYLKKIQSEFKGEKVVYLDYKMTGDDKAVIETKILRETVEIPVNYSMFVRGDTWRIYDVNIEGVSLMNNYRVQFNSILLKESPARLIETLRKKLEEP